MGDKDLFSRMDEAAFALLNEAFGATSVEGGLAPEDESKSLPEKVKAFDAVRSWLCERVKLAPEERGKGKGEQLRAKFHSRKASSRRTAKAGSESSSIDDSADGHPTANGSAAGGTA